MTAVYDVSNTAIETQIIFFFIWVHKYCSNKYYNFFLYHVLRNLSVATNLFGALLILHCKQNSRSHKYILSWSTNSGFKRNFILSSAVSNIQRINKQYTKQFEEVERYQRNWKSFVLAEKMNRSVKKININQFRIYVPYWLIIHRHLYSQANTRG